MSQPRAVAAILAPITRRALGRGQAAIGALMSDWPAVVGESWAARCVPAKLSFPAGKRDGGVLHLKVDPADAVLVLHDSAALLARINGHHGYAAIDRITLVQVPLDRPAPARPRRLSDDDAAAVEQCLSHVADPAWHNRFAALGRALFRRVPGK